MEVKPQKIMALVMLVTAEVRYSQLNKSAQSGVALLQVLLIGAVISVLAVRLTVTAQDQLEMASLVDQRVKAEMKAKSVLNEVLFLELSESILPYDDNASLISLPPKSRLNRFGAIVDWSEEVQVVIQDMNGLLPQMFVDHFLWRPVLLALNIEDNEVESYLGSWGDMQDDDLVSWDGAGEEPSALPNGGQFINGYAQNDKLLVWVFSEQPQVLKVLQSISDINALYETNLLNSPDALLTLLLEPSAAEAFSIARRSEGQNLQALIAMLPEVYQSPTLSSYSSNELRISVQVNFPDNSWLESQVVSLTSGSNPPFEVRLKR